MKIKLIFYFLILISLVACNEKKNEIDPDLLLSVALLQPPDQAENYDRDVQIITHTPQGFPVGCDINYSDADVNFFAERLLKREIVRYPRGYWIKAGAGRIVLCRYLVVPEKLRFSTK
ncbi:Putative lipoprotein [Leptospira santarosai]|uniref:Lipoprotein n=1 Tax=Leptospira santarosai TaxID=28183 RepID=A0A2P1QY36_9LEPT|nr:Putative lipoprotein [Leptospira santarosai]